MLNFYEYIHNKSLVLLVNDTVDKREKTYQYRFKLSLVMCIYY